MPSDYESGESDHLVPDHRKRPPRIFDAVELPESEKGGECPMHVGKGARQCKNRVEYVFVYEAFTDPDDDQRKNCRCCADCKPRVTAEGALRADGGQKGPCIHCGKSVETRFGGWSSCEDCSGDHDE